MAQLSLFSESSIFEQAQLKQRSKAEFYCDVFVGSYIDEKKQRIRIRPLANQPISSELFVCCSHKARNFFPEGTIFKIDVRLAYGKKGKKYLRSRTGQPLQRAIEYFNHNLALQKTAHVHKQNNN